MKRAEKFAAIILDGKSTWLGNGHPYDVYWNSQGRRVEVKGLNIKSDQIGAKVLKADIGHNWDKNDYYMLMIYIDGEFNHCYLIPSADITNRRKQSKSITIPRKWDNFAHRDRLYAMMTERGLIRV